jgi:hypothetical protein
MSPRSIYFVLAAFALSGCGSPGKASRTARVDEKAAASAHATTDGKRIHDAVTCAGSEELELRQVRIEVEDVAIHSKGACNITIVDSEIIAGDVAIVVSGSGRVEVSRSRVRGGRAAVAIAGSGQVKARATRFVGGRSITGTGDFHDDGENSWE